MVKDLHFVIANVTSNSGKALRRWEKVQIALKHLESSSSRVNQFEFEVIETRSIAEGKAAVDRAIELNAKSIIAAGGDGTINAVLNALMDPDTDRPKLDCALGAIGLGSSNDFQKPFNERLDLAGFPSKINSEDTSAVDVGKASYIDISGVTHNQYFILNSSVGFIAKGNAFFNTKNKLLMALKRVHVETAIIYTAMVNLIKFKPIEVALSLDGQDPEMLTAVNISILKKRHVAGGMSYDTPIVSDDGMFDVNVFTEMNQFEFLKSVFNLYQGKFLGQAKTKHWRASEVTIKRANRKSNNVSYLSTAAPLTAPFHLELDGEVQLVREVKYSVIPKAIKLCG